MHQFLSQFGGGGGKSLIGRGKWLYGGNAERVGEWFGDGVDIGVVSEALVQIEVNFVCKITNFYIHIFSNGNAVDITTYSVRVNGVASALSIAVPASGTGSFTDTSEVDLVAGDKISLHATSDSLGTVDIRALVVEVQS